MKQNVFHPIRPIVGRFLLIIAALAGASWSVRAQMPHIPPPIPRYNAPTLPAHQHFAPPTPRTDWQATRMQMDQSAMNRHQIDQASRQSYQMRQQADSFRNAQVQSQSLAQSQQAIRQAQAMASQIHNQTALNAQRSSLPLRPYVSSTFPNPSIPGRTPSQRHLQRQFHNALPLSRILNYGHIAPGVKFHFPNDPSRQYQWVKQQDASARNLANGNVARIPVNIPVIPVRGMQ